MTLLLNHRSTNKKKKMFWFLVGLLSILSVAPECRRLLHVFFFFFFPESTLVSCNLYSLSNQRKSLTFFSKYAHCFSCGESKEMINTTFMSVWWKCSWSQQLDSSLALKKNEIGILSNHFMGKIKRVSDFPSFLQCWFVIILNAYQNQLDRIKLHLVLD